jgi:hypothetical protein
MTNHNNSPEDSIVLDSTNGTERALETLTEEELDEKIRSHDREDIMLQKRSYLEARSRGENPKRTWEAQSEAPSEDPAPKRAKKGGGTARWQLPTLRFKGESYHELHLFLYELRSRFDEDDGDLTTDKQKINDTTSCFVDTVKRRWVYYVTDAWGGDISRIPWSTMVQWLNDYIADGPTRSLTATQQLAPLQQKADETFDKFLDRFEVKEAELPDLLPNSYQVSMLLTKLKPQLRSRLILAGIPKNRHDLITQARRAEASMEELSAEQAATSQPSRRERWSAANTSRGDNRGTPANPSSQPPADGDRSETHPTGKDAAASSMQCYNCQEIGHLASRCPKIECYNCGKKGHRAAACRQPKDANTTPVGASRRPAGE